MVLTCIPTTPYMKKTSIISNATYGSALKDLMKVHRRFRIDSLLPRSFTRLLKRKLKDHNDGRTKLFSKLKVYIKIYASSILKMSYRIARKRRRKPILAPPPSLSSVIAISTKDPITITQSNLFHESLKYSLWKIIN